MTDEQIIQALECCYIHGKQCGKCRTNDFECLELEKITLDLINRQKAEIEKLREHIELLDIENEAIKISAIKEFAKKVKEEIAVWHFDFTYYSDILEACQKVDNIAKRMVGESK